MNTSSQASNSLTDALRFLVGCTSLGWLGLWYLLSAWSRGMAAFGNPSTSPTDALFDYFPFVVFGMLLVSAVLVNRWLLHLATLVAVPAALLSVYVTFHNPIIGLPLIGYLALWFKFYHHVAWS